VAIVNWNTSGSAADAATAYLASTGVRASVTIVDNGSGADQRDELRRRAPAAARIVWAGRNQGYGRAANSVLDHAGADLVCASNADVRPAPDMLDQLARVVLADDRVGVGAPCFDDGLRPYHARLPRAMTLPIRTVLGGWGHRPVDYPEPGRVAEVEQPGGACLLARASTWRALGGFDPGFFLWFEDVDLARRILAGGRRNVVVGDARAAHRGGDAFVQMDRRLRHAIRLRSIKRYVAKHHPRLLPLTRVLAGVGQVVWVRSPRLVRAARRLAEEAGDLRQPG
jgi:N-acetylglucosaminyl-diphospho-decaprenol L-rhamnosyltransferase